MVEPMPSVGVAGIDVVVGDGLFVITGFEVFVTLGCIAFVGSDSAERRLF